MDTFNDNPDKEWWSKIVTNRGFGSGAPELKGWFMVDLLNIPDANYISDAPSGLVTVPMTITDGTNEEQSAIVAGMVGYKFHEKDDDAKKVYSLEPVHGWSLLIEKNSAFRIDMDNWEENFLAFWFEFYKEEKSSLMIINECPFPVLSLEWASVSCYLLSP